MECPKCGAANPDGADHCNLCHRSFIERDETVACDADIEPGVSLRPVTARPARLLGPSTAVAWQGGLIALSAGLLFLLFLGLFQVIGLPVFKFLWLGVTLNKPALSYFLLVIGLFTLVSSAVAGNLEGKKNVVPVLRLLAGLTGVALWTGLVLALKPQTQTFAAWLAGGISGLVTAVAAFPVTGVCLGMVESFGEEWDPGLFLRKAVGGLAAGCGVALVATLAFTAVPLFGEEMPIGAGPVTLFSLKIVLGTVVIGFVSGFAFWLAMARADRHS